MFEHRSLPLLSRTAFLVRFLKGLALSLVLVTISILGGMLGYRHFENMSWIDAFANASMILSGMGPLGPLNTFEGKLFAGFYALYSGLAFITLVGITFAPVVHRVLHKLHMEEQAEEKAREQA